MRSLDVNPTSLADRLRLQLDALPGVLAGKDESQLREEPASGQWSAFDQIAHLARHQALFLDRVQLILDQPEPAMPPYRAEQDHEWTEWRQRSLTRIIGRLHEDRRRLADVVGRLSPEQLERVGVHGVFGAMPLAAWLEFFLAHAGHHLYVAFKRAHEVHEDSGE
jgi:uncharacterized damage-inducible protein DinB